MLLWDVLGEFQCTQLRLPAHTSHTLCALAPDAAQDQPCSAAMPAAVLVPRAVISHVLANCQAVPKQWHTVIAQHSWVMVLFGGDWVMSTDPVLPHTWAHPSRSLSGAPCSGGRWDQWCGHWSCQLASGTESWDEHLWVNRHNSYMWDLTTWRLFSSIYAKSLFLG